MESKPRKPQPEPDPIYAFLDGKTWTVNGISGTLKHRMWYALYPYERWVESFELVPDEAGKATEQYKAEKRKAGDDWVIDLTWSIDHMCEAAVAYGYFDSPEECTE